MIGHLFITKDQKQNAIESEQLLLVVHIEPTENNE